VQVDPIEPTLKPPGTKHLKLKCDILLSTFAFKFNVRRYDMELIAFRARAAVLAQDLACTAAMTMALTDATGRGATLVHFSAQRKRFLWDRGCM
jgi:hypothetical protein